MRFQKWHPRRLQAMYGDRLFECGKGVHSDETLLTNLNRFCKLKHPQSRRRCYVFDSTFDADCPELLDDYSIPSVFQIGRPGASCAHPAHSNRWLLMGHAGSGSQLHVDPLRTSAWNALVYGLKEWVVIQPLVMEDRPHGDPHPFSPDDMSLFYQRLHDRASSTPLNRWFTNNMPRLWRHALCVAAYGSHPCSTHGRFIPRMMRFVQRPGDIVHIPHGWLHAVLNRSLSVAITHNFIHPESNLSPCMRDESFGHASAHER